MGVSADSGVLPQLDRHSMSTLDRRPVAPECDRPQRITNRENMTGDLRYQLLDADNHFRLKGRLSGEEKRELIRALDGGIPVS